jgi:hypothetical protein
MSYGENVYKLVTKGLIINAKNNILTCYRFLGESLMTTSGWGGVGGKIQKGNGRRMEEEIKQG